SVCVSDCALIVGSGVDTVRLRVRTIPKIRASASVPMAASATTTSFPTSRRGISDLLRGGVERNHQFEGAADARRAFQPDTPAVHLGQRPRNRQADARVTQTLDQRVVSAVQAAEDAALLLQRNAAALVTHSQVNHVAHLAAGTVARGQAEVRL